MCDPGAHTPQTEQASTVYKNLREWSHSSSRRIFLDSNSFKQWCLHDTWEHKHTRKKIESLLVIKTNLLLVKWIKYFMLVTEL